MRSWAALGVVLALTVLSGLLPAPAMGEQASEPGSPAAGQLDLGWYHSCAVLPAASVRCWGYGGDGALGYASTMSIGDDETPAAAGPVDLGTGRTATAVAAGSVHTCALLNGGAVRCWGFGHDGRLGYGNTGTVGDDETPAAAGPVDLGTGRSAKAIAAGRAHTCAVLDNDSVRCWGFGFDGRLGYGNNPPNVPFNIGDDETPGSVAPVNLGAGRTASAISAGDTHTCAVLDDGSVRCWGLGTSGQLGNGNTDTVGDDESPAVLPPVRLGAGRTAKAIAAADLHTCALLDNGAVRCWGLGVSGRLGYGNAIAIGDDETPDVAGPVDLGAGRTARAIAAGTDHSCALLDDASLRCWGLGLDGRLGYGSTASVGDDESPASAGPVDLGTGRSATAMAGGRHTCASLDDGSVRCWGAAGNGRLGLCSLRDVGDDEPPSSTGPVDLGVPGLAGAACAPAVPPPGGGTRTPPSSFPSPSTSPVDPRAAERRRARMFHTCLRRATRHARAELRHARRSSARKRNLARRHARSHLRRARAACRRRHGRTPGQVRGLRARAISKTRISLSFNAAGSDGSNAPAARTYLIKQSPRAIRGARAFRRAQSLCRGRCRFPAIAKIGGRLTLEISDLRPHTTYYYAVAARDNVSRRLGRRSTTVSVRTR